MTSRFLYRLEIFGFLYFESRGTFNKCSTAEHPIQSRPAITHRRDLLKVAFFIYLKKELFRSPGLLQVECEKKTKINKINGTDKSVKWDRCGAARRKLWFIFSDLIKFIAGELNLMDILPEWNEEKLFFFRPAEKLIATKSHGRKIRVNLEDCLLGSPIFGLVNYRETTFIDPKTSKREIERHLTRLPTRIWTYFWVNINAT